MEREGGSVIRTIQSSDDSVGIILGVMDFGTRVDEAEAFAILDRYRDRGGGWVDTANCYSFWADEAGLGGASERVVGRWLRARSGARDAVKIATKVGQNPVEAHRWPESAEGLSRSSILPAAEASLERLGLDRLDLLWAHAEDRGVALEETVQAFGDLVSEGKVGRVGAANHPCWRVERARAVAQRLGVEPWSAIQLRHSLVQPRPLTTLPEAGHRHLTLDDLDLARDSAMSVWAYTPLLHGGYVRSDKPLSEPYDHPGTHRILAGLEEVALDLGATKNQIVLAWLMAQGISPIVGVSRIHYLDEALDASAIALTAEHVERLETGR